LKDAIENYKIFDKKAKKNNKKSKEKGPNWNHYYHWKNIYHKLDLNDEIQAIKTLIKEQRKTIKKLKV
jgi:hypothetical protein